jgi:hypothetical protein
LAGLHPTIPMKSNAMAQRMASCLRVEENCDTGRLFKVDDNSCKGGFNPVAFILG